MSSSISALAFASVEAMGPGFEIPKPSLPAGGKFDPGAAERSLWEVEALSDASGPRCNGFVTKAPAPEEREGQRKLAMY